MKKFAKIALTGALSLGLFFGAAPQTVSAEIAAGNPSPEMTATFKENRLPASFVASDGWSNGGICNVFWHDENVTFKGGRVQLVLDRDKIGNAEKIPYASGELRSTGFYGYGRYEIKLKPARNDGVVTAFTVYTGPTDNNQWDQICVEFFGKNTKKVRFNYYKDGRGNHEYLHTLPFDAARGIHTYAFEWHKDRIAWFVDGEEVHVADRQIPVTKGRIMVNTWSGKTDAEDWLKGLKASKFPLVAECEWIKFTPFNE